MITKSALLLLQGRWPDSKLLLVREYGKKHWIFPGGVQEPGETIEEALAREVREELSADVKDVEKIGIVEGHTADGAPLVIHLFHGSVVGELIASSEISVLRWVSRNELDDIRPDLTPITLEIVLPLLYERKIW